MDSGQQRFFHEGFEPAVFISLQNRMLRGIVTGFSGAGLCILVKGPVDFNPGAKIPELFVGGPDKRGLIRGLMVKGVEKNGGPSLFRIHLFAEASSSREELKRAIGRLTGFRTTGRLKARIPSSSRKDHYSQKGAPHNGRRLSEEMAGG